MLAALLTTMRPRQWVKNLLVAAAPLAAGTLHHRTEAVDTLVTFVSFCLMSSAIYCVNDVCDVAADRAHPVKKARPIAAGLLSAPVAAAAAGVLAAASIVLAVLCHTHQLWIVLLAYAATSVLYSFGLKHEAVLELALVAGGFLLRAVAGGIAVALPLSRWFLIVASFGSLLIVAGKRLSELLATDPSAPATRRSLASYTPSYLRMLIGIAAAVTSTAYCLWAFEIADRRGGSWAAISVAPFVVAIFRYCRDADAGVAEQPELIGFRDHVLQALGLLWLIAFVLAATRG